jgi:hypothetical protein
VKLTTRLLIPDQKQQIASSSMKFVDKIDDDRNVLKRIVNSVGH